MYYSLVVCAKRKNVSQQNHSMQVQVWIALPPLKISSMLLAPESIYKDKGTTKIAIQLTSLLYILPSWRWTFVAVVDLHPDRFSR